VLVPGGGREVMKTRTRRQVDRRNASVSRDYDPAIAPTFRRVGVPRLFEIACRADICARRWATLRALGDGAAPFGTVRSCCR
jgi:hypothetical protein